jgi:hypothetical protein
MPTLPLNQMERTIQKEGKTMTNTDLAIKNTENKNQTQKTQNNQNQLIAKERNNSLVWIQAGVNLWFLN